MAAQKKPRSAQDVIDQVIAENRRWEWFCFVAASVFILLGVALVMRALVMDGTSVVVGILAGSGSLTAALFWPALRMAMRIRKENQAIRLLEIPLGKAETAEAAADMLREMFQQIYVEKKG